MGSYPAVLIILLLLGALPAHAAPRQPRCISCHAVHYADQGDCPTCHRGNVATSRRELAHSGLISGRLASFRDLASPAVLRGKQLAEQSSCRRCHQLHRSGNRLASNLDNLLQSNTVETIAQAIAEPASSMPAFHFSQPDQDALITALLAGGVGGMKPIKEPPQVVHFSSQQTSRQNSFVKYCGGCHKLLSQQDGGLGQGTAGPNLSGLLSRFYPVTFQDHLPWTEQRLKRWLKNPRDTRPSAMMRPVTLEQEAWQQLLKTMRPK